MNLYEFQQQFKSNSLYNFYVFTGTETAIMRQYITRISVTAKKPVEWVESLQECLLRISRSVLVAAPKLFIVQDDRMFLSRPNLWSKMPSLLKKHTLILIYSKFDGRSKFVKQHEAVCVAFNKLPAETLSKYIMKKINLTETNAKSLAEVCECSYDRVLQEIDKIQAYADYRATTDSPITVDQAFRLCLSEGVIYRPIGDITFELVDAIVSRRDLNKIETLLIQAKLIQEPPLLTLSLLYNKYRSIMIYKSLGNDTENASERSGLTSSEIRTAKYNQSVYTLEELKNIVYSIQELEYGIKTGGIREDAAIDYFIAKYL